MSELNSLPDEFICSIEPPYEQYLDSCSDNCCSDNKWPEFFVMSVYEREGDVYTKTR